jgi:hypothetical protein
MSVITPVLEPGATTDAPITGKAVSVSRTMPVICDVAVLANKHKTMAIWKGLLVNLVDGQ